MNENMGIKGTYQVECYDANGLRWRDVIENVVTTVGKNLALTAFFTGSPYTVTGPFCGLISSISYTTTAITDTMMFREWLEAGGDNAPQYVSPRPVTAWAAAFSGTISLLSPLSFAITSPGTIMGAFLVFGYGATNTIDNTEGTLYSAGVFTSGAKIVGIGDTISVSYTASM
jgi:hypothetical protein